MAAQFDVDPATIKRDAEFARAVNTIAENVGRTKTRRFRHSYDALFGMFCFQPQGLSDEDRHRLRAAWHYVGL